MPRPRRLFVPGFPVHLVHRGNNRQDIFLCDRDFRVFRSFLKEAVDGLDVAVNGYVFMTNHIHLLLTPADALGISKVMHSTSRRYAGYFNTAYGRTGTLWEGRFHAALIANDRFLLACHRYIDMNPVRAGIVGSPDQYPWSSHRHYACGERDSIVTAHQAVESIGLSRESRQAAYRALFEGVIDQREIDAIRRASRGCRRVDGGQGQIGRPKKENRP
jgi:putative transposase